MVYLLDGKRVSLLGEDDSSVTVAHDWYFAVYNLFTLAGDSVSRRIVYHVRPRNPFWYILFSAVGFVLCLSRIGAPAPRAVVRPRSAALTPSLPPPLQAFSRPWAYFAFSSPTAPSTAPAPATSTRTSTASTRSSLCPSGSLSVRGELPAAAPCGLALTHAFRPVCAGDIGSVAGSNILEYVRVWFCAEAHKYVCVTHGG